MKKKKDTSWKNSPRLYLGHDFKNPILPWAHFECCAGVLVNAYQLNNFVGTTGAKQLRHRLQFSGDVMMDSGGFQVSRNIKPPSRDEILKVYNQTLPDACVVLDKPSLPNDSPQRKAANWKRTITDTKWMISESSSQLNLAPVIHIAARKTLVSRCQQVSAITKNPSTICIGGMVPYLKQSYIGPRFRNNRISATVAKWRYIANCIKTVKQFYPESKIHVLGAGSISTTLLLFAIGVDSVDSVGWRLKAAFGAIQLEGVGDRFLKARPHSSKYRKQIDNQDRKNLKKCGCPVCKNNRFRIRDLSSCFEKRAIHNAFVMCRLVSNIPRLQSDLFGFIRARVPRHSLDSVNYLEHHQEEFTTYE